MNRIILICFLLFPIVINGKLRSCPNTDVSIFHAVSRSSIVVYGQSIGKTLYVDTDNERLFNVTFRVDCIFKGQEIESRIEITDAGIQKDRISCQYLDPGKFFVVFLEKCGSIANVYCPIDVQERPADDTTMELLRRICRLKRIPPLNSTTNNCPNVSIDKVCQYDINSVTIKPKVKLLDDVYINGTSSSDSTGQDFYGSDVKNIKNGLLIDRIADNPRSTDARLSALTSVWIINLTVCMLMLIKD